MHNVYHYLVKGATKVGDRRGELMGSPLHSSLKVILEILVYFIFLTVLYPPPHPPSLLGGYAMPTALGLGPTTYNTTTTTTTTNG